MLGKYQKIKHRIVEYTPERIVLKGLFPLSLIGGKLTFKIEKHESHIILFEILEFGFKSYMGRLLNVPGHALALNLACDKNVQYPRAIYRKNI